MGKLARREPTCIASRHLQFASPGLSASALNGVGILLCNVSFKKTR
jgi:hypothetical protein